MIRSFVLAGTAMMLLATAPAAAAQKTPDYVTAAVDDTARPVDDKQLDGERKPAEMLMIARVKPGMRVMDLIPGTVISRACSQRRLGPKAMSTPSSLLNSTGS